MLLARRFSLFFLLFAGWLTTPALASKDVVQFGSSIHVAPDSTIQDAVCFFCSVDVQGNVNGDIVVFFGSVHIQSPAGPGDSASSGGHANHDVVAFFGDVKAGDHTSIGESLVNIFGSTHLGEGVSVGQDAVVLFGDLRAAGSATIGGDRVVQPGWLFWVPFLLIASGISFLVREVRWQRRRRLLRGY